MLFGDGDDGQSESVADTRAVSSQRLQQSQLLRDMVASPWTKLKAYRRGDDKFLFDVYHGLYDSEETVQSMVARTRKEFPSCGDPDLALCICHNKRILTYKSMNATKAPDNAVRVCAEEDIQGILCQPQDMFLLANMERIGRPRGRANKYGVVQGVAHTLLFMARFPCCA